MGFRPYFWRGWILLVADLAIFYSLPIGYAFYFTSGHLLLQALGVHTLCLILLWTAPPAYVFR